MRDIHRLSVYTLQCIWPLCCGFDYFEIPRVVYIALGVYVSRALVFKLCYNSNLTPSASVKMYSQCLLIWLNNNAPPID